MNSYLLCALLFLACSLMNLFNVARTGNGFSFVMGGVWLIASIMMFLRYRKNTQKKDEPEGEGEGA